MAMPFLERNCCLLSALHLKALLSSPKAVCLELSIEWTDIGDASRRDKEGQVELGVALLGLCILQNSIEKPGGTVSCPVKQSGCTESVSGSTVGHWAIERDTGSWPSLPVERWAL